MYTRILVPLDGSKLAERALPAAEELARLVRAPLHLVRMVDPAHSNLGRDGFDESVLAQVASSLFLTEEGAAADAYLARMTAREIEQGLGASGEVRYGATAREIVAMAQPGDLIVMSTHGRGGLVRWFLGSVAEDVVRRAPVPVLLIRIDAEHDEPVGLRTPV
jgi:nucleotide-binding universal stress UspA family protein